MARPSQSLRACHTYRIAVAAALACGCSNTDSTAGKRGNAPPTTRAPSAVASPRSGETSSGPLRFVDVADSAGVRFRHYSPLTEQRHVHLVMGSGIGWLDFDHDGWPDLYCCQGTSLNENSNNEHATNLLFRNREAEVFSDVTVAAGLLDTHYSMGVAAADFDNDGFADLCVTGYGVNTLLHNQGDGTFNQIEFPQRSVPGRLSASCAWADIDADGSLDLYITNYAQLGPEDYPICEHTAAEATIHIACHPSNLERLPDLLYRNTGDGQFTDISLTAGIVAEEARQGLGVIAADLDRDGDADFYVANDTTSNYLWENRGDGQFTDRGPDSGTSTNRHGAREACMGIAIGDVDGNGQFDLFVTNFYNETNTLYRNEGSLLFSDVTDELGLGAPSRLRLAFGVSLSDFDNDGWLDLFVANGHIHDRLHVIGRDEPFAQLAQVFYNEGGTRFRDASDTSGAYFREPHVGRGTAVADYDRDGDADVAVNQLNSDVALLQNQTEKIGRWLRVELIGTESNRNGVGATLQIDLGDRMLLRTVQAGGSYLSCDDGELLIGIGESDKVRKISVVWPGGRRESWHELTADRLWRLVEGSGSETGAR